MGASEDSAKPRWAAGFRDAKAHFENAEWSNAILRFCELLSDQEYLPEKARVLVHRRLSEAYLAIGDLEKALEHSNEVIFLNPNIKLTERDCKRTSSILEFMGRHGEATDLLVKYANLFRRKFKDRHESPVPNIVVILLPKSGSTSNSQALSSALEYHFVEFPNRQSNSLFSGAAPVHQCYRTISGLGVVVHSHLLPKSDHRDFISNLPNSEFVLRVRDPHDALVSALDMVHRRNAFQILKRNRNLTSLPLEAQFDWMIEHYFPRQRKSATAAIPVRVQKICESDAALVAGTGS